MISKYENMIFQKVKFLEIIQEKKNLIFDDLESWSCVSKEFKKF